MKRSTSVERRAIAPHQAKKAGKALSPARSGPLVRWNAPPLLVIFGIFAVYYLWTVLPRFNFADAEPGIYNQIADAFLHGQVSLLTKPNPQLLQLSDPYDPELNRFYRLHDMSLYNGKYYAYFGPSAAIVLFAPYRALTGHSLPTRVGAALFASGAFIASCLLLSLLLGHLYPRTPRGLFYGLCVTLGFCSTFPFLLRRPEVYELAISSAQFFLMAGLALIAYAAYDRYSIRSSIAAGLLLAAAVGARASLILAAPVIVLLVVLDRGDTVEHRRRKVVAAALPVVISVVLWAVYNWIRFDSPSEFGTQYQLSAMHPARTVLFNVDRIPWNTLLLLLYPPKLSAAFPFFLPRTPEWPLGETYLLFEAVTGLLWASPLLIALLFTPWVLRREPPERRRALAWLLAALIGNGATLLVLDSMLMATMRYEADFSTLFFVAAALVIAAAVQRIRMPRGKLTAYVTIGVLATFGIALNAAIGLMGYYGGLDLGAPQQFQFLQSVFSPLAALLRVLGVGT